MRNTRPSLKEGYYEHEGDVRVSLTNRKENTMHSQNVISINANESLQQMLFIKNCLLNDIYEKDGEILPSEDNELTRLDLAIPSKVDAWAWLLMKDGGIDKDIELLTERKKAIDEIIQKLKSTKGRLKAKANEILRQNKLEKIEGNNFWFKRDVSRTSRVIISLVEDEYKSFELPKLSYEEYCTLKNALEEHMETSEVNYHSMFTLATKLKDEVVESCGVKTLPENHKAIEVKEEQTIRVYEKRQ